MLKRRRAWLQEAISRDDSLAGTHDTGRQPASSGAPPACSGWCVEFVSFVS
jgi:hypothetical protein